MAEIISPPRELTRQEMREVLLKQGILGTIYHVGSDPSSPADALRNVIQVEAARSGFISWPQGPSALEDMDIQPNYHPQLGLYYQDGKLHFDETKFINQIDKLETDDLDFHPLAAQGWYNVLENVPQLKSVASKSGRAVIAKSHTATPSCSEHVLPDDAKSYQPLWYRAEMRGHIKKLKSVGDVQIVSGDWAVPLMI